VQVRDRRKLLKMMHSAAVSKRCATSGVKAHVMGSKKRSR
jgi:hypothetical protein